MKRCRTCGLDKPLTEYTKAKKNKSGYTSQCKSCIADYMRAYYANNPKQYAKHKGYVAINDASYKQPLHKYGLTHEQFDAMMERYEGLCWSCKESPANVIDHDHRCCPTSNGRRKTCGKCVRGLLCNGCNTGLGFFRDSPERLHKAIDYLDSQA